MEQSTPKRTRVTGRKLKLTTIILSMATATPIGFHLIGIGENVTTMVLSVYIAAGSVYGIANVVDKRFGGEG